MSAHGTESGYTQGCRCDECKAASAKARRDRRAGRGPGKTPPGQQGHGWSGYNRHGCRCEVCTRSNSDAHRRWAQRKKAAA